jgi:predicted O-methyltransferase YrrM
VSPERTAAFAGEFIPEDEPLLDARRNALDLGGVTPVSPAVGAVLRFVAATVAAKTMVEIGTGCGSSGIWLLRGARPDAVLTSVDSEPEHHRLARQAYGAAGFAANRYRLIRQEYPDDLAAALRLLRPGGVAAFNDVWWDGRPAPRGHADPEETAARQVCEQVRDDERLVPLLVPAGDGLLAAVRRTS